MRADWTKVGAALFALALGACSGTARQEPAPGSAAATAELAVAATAREPVRAQLPSGAGGSPARFASPSPIDPAALDAVAIIPVPGADPNVRFANEDPAQLAAARALGLALVDPARETELRRALQRAAVAGFLAKGDCTLVRVRLDMDFVYAGSEPVGLAGPGWLLPAAMQGCGRLEHLYLAVSVPEAGPVTAHAFEPVSLTGPGADGQAGSPAAE
ncbi:MAG: hypothetical protein HXY25_07360 [Alphaproteobacteria bacterium]|nr:hypothetical protein [Alphaproteobacteria bacterium]